MSIVLNKEPVRCGYVVINEAKKNNLNDQMEYSMQLIIPKGSVTHILLEAEVDSIIEAKHGNKPPHGIRRPLRDADAEAEEKGNETAPHLKNCMFMNVRTKERPGIVGPDGLPHPQPEDCRSGDFFYISLGGFYYPKPQPGVSFGLNNVQFVKKGDTLTGRKRAEDEFGAVEERTASDDPMFE